MFSDFALNLGKIFFLSVKVLGNVGITFFFREIFFENFDLFFCETFLENFLIFFFTKFFGFEIILG